MLVLARKVGQVLYVGDDITVTVLKTRGRNWVEIGIQAPPDVQIRRGEMKQHGGHDADEER